MKKLNLGDIVRVDWYDHYSNQSSWKSLDEARHWNIQLAKCSTVGLVVSQDKDQVIIAQNWHGSFGEDSVPKCADFMVIIKGCIQKVTILYKKEFIYK